MSQYPVRQPTEPRRLRRSRAHKWVGGVLGGLARFFSMDVYVLRLVVALAVLITGLFPGVFIYLLAWMILPFEGAERPRR